MTKNAIILIPCFFTGGTEVATLDTAVALKKMGYSVTVIVYFDETECAMIENLRQKGINVQLLGLARLKSFSGSFVLTKAIALAMWRRRPELVWVQYMTPTLLPILISRFFTHKLVAVVHVSARHYSSNGLRRLRWLAGWWCNQLICVSQTTAQGILGKHPTARLQKAVCVIPNALDMAEVSVATPRNWREELCIELDKTIIGFVGRLAANKGADVLLQAAELVNRDFPQVNWIIVGGGNEQEALKKQAIAAGLAEKVHFLGPITRDMVYSAIKGFDIAVVPSREEGFGLTALEAMACGVPLVASKVDALQEIVLDEKTGFLFSSENAYDLASKLCRLLASPDVGRKLTRAALENVIRSYSTDRLADNIASMLRIVESGIE